MYPFSFPTPYSTGATTPIVLEAAKWLELFLPFPQPSAHISSSFSQYLCSCLESKRIWFSKHLGHMVHVRTRRHTKSSVPLGGISDLKLNQLLWTGLKTDDIFAFTFMGNGCQIKNKQTRNPKHYLQVKMFGFD